MSLLTPKQVISGPITQTTEVYNRTQMILFTDTRMIIVLQNSSQAAVAQFIHNGKESIGFTFFPTK